MFILICITIWKVYYQDILCIYVSHQVPFESRKTGPLYLRNLSSLVAINIPLHCLISTINCWWILNFKIWFSWYQIVIWICSSLAFGLITISAGWYWCVYGAACYELSWSSGKNTQQNGICIAKSHLSQKPSEKDVPYLQDSWRSKQELVSDTLLWTPQWIH